MLKLKNVIAGCEKCKDGCIYIPKENGFGVNFKYCDCFIEAESLNKSIKLFKASNISPKLLNLYTCVGWEVPENTSLEGLISIIDNKNLSNNWAYIHGPTGTGKTYIAVLMAVIALLREMSVYFWPVTDLLESLRPGMGNPKEILQKCRTADVLILDDIGHEKSSQWVRERLYMIINNRWNSGKITIFTSNFPPENLKESISGAVYSRVKGDSYEIKLFSKDDKRIT
jgi:DNA replication protein DnaC